MAIETATKEIRSVTMHRVVDDDPDLSYLEDDNRIRLYREGQWSMVGVYAQAEIVVANTIQQVRSGGLWGIESDSDSSYFAEIEKDELNDLVTVLEELGFDRTAIDEACADMVDANE